MKNADLAVLKAEARAMKLVYTSDHMPGYSREKKNDHFIFFDTQGKEIKDEDEVKRIRKLALPPAWTKVWISPKANGHLQATGIDVAGRKQYKYHAQWSLLRNEHKHNRMLEFGEALPLIRKKVEHDLHHDAFDKAKVVAIAISVMDRTFIRVGNAAYQKMYGTYGLTSLRNKHIKISGNKMVIAFKGKKGVFQQVSLTHSRLAKMMNKLKDIPGQELFQYFDNDGSKKSIDSGCVNEYLELCTGKDFTAKDFRTWWGTVNAFSYLADIVHGENSLSVEKNILGALDFVAEKLGNTRTVCKKYYVHPKLLSHYQEGKLGKYLDKLNKSKNVSHAKIHEIEEKLTMEFLKRECKVAA